MYLHGTGVTRSFAAFGGSCAPDSSQSVQLLSPNMQPCISFCRAICMWYLYCVHSLPLIDDHMYTETKMQTLPKVWQLEKPWRMNEHKLSFCDFLNLQREQSFFYLQPMASHTTICVLYLQLTFGVYKESNVFHLPSE